MRAYEYEVSPRVTPSTGYGAKTLPGVREAIEGSRWDEANREVRDVAEVLGRLNERIEAAIRLL